MIKIIFLGKPGVGKGTIAKIIEKQKQIIHISTGDIFRKEIHDQTELGKKIKNILATGEFVTDEITNQIIAKTLKLPEVQKHGFILDGYPRTLNQAKFLDTVCKIDYVIQLNVDDEIISERLGNRFICEAGKHIFNLKFNPPKKVGICDIDHSRLYQRDDDKPSQIINRLKVYEQKTAPLINFYKNQHKLIEINSISDDPITTAKQLCHEVKIDFN